MPVSYPFRLPHGDLAYYAWGSTLIRSQRYSAARGLGVEALVRAEFESRGTWTSDREFVAVVAYYHEIIHLMQDLFTGAGYWDFWTTARTLRDERYWEGRPPGPSLVHSVEMGNRVARVESESAIRFHYAGKGRAHVRACYRAHSAFDTSLLSYSLASCPSPAVIL